MPIKIMIVDDAVVVRHILTDTLKSDADLQVVGAAIDGRDAMEKLPRWNPDIVLLDVEMPNMDGIETLLAIKAQYPHLKVIMFSTLTSRGAAATMDALMAGADDYVTKPANVGSVAAAIDTIRNDLVPRVKALCNVQQRTATEQPTQQQQSTHTRAKSPTRVVAPRPATATPRPTTPSEVRPSAPRNMEPVKRPIGIVKSAPQIVCIAVSTGGPNALAELLPLLPSSLSVPLVIVQHIPPLFSKALADRLDRLSALEVHEAANGDTLRPGGAWIAPGDYHMTIKKVDGIPKIELNQGPPENSCRPAADVLFRSVVANYGGACLGVILTGMGGDGTRGGAEIVQAGGGVIAQDEATSVVWGMPGTAVAAGVVDGLFPLRDIAREITTRTEKSRPGPLNATGNATSNATSLHNSSSLRSR